VLIQLDEDKSIIRPEEARARTEPDAPYVHPDLVGDISAKYFDNYLITAGDDVVIDGMQHGRGMAVTVFDVQGAVYSAYLDMDTCDLCASLDGIQVEVPSDAYYSLSPKQHRKCRCMWVLVLRSETDFEPDRDPFAALHAAAANSDKTIGELLVGSAHQNEALQQRFQVETQKAREEIAARKTERAAKAFAKLARREQPEV